MSEERPEPDCNARAAAGGIVWREAHAMHNPMSHATAPMDDRFIIEREREYQRRRNLAIAAANDGSNVSQLLFIQLNIHRTPN